MNYWKTRSCRAFPESLGTIRLGPTVTVIASPIDRRSMISTKLRVGLLAIHIA